MNNMNILLLVCLLGTCSAAWWRPKVGETWNLQFVDKIDTSVAADIFDLDMDQEQNAINTLRSKGKKLICYVDVGSWEEYRSDANQFPDSVKGNVYSPQYKGLI
jgi:hypothetical protein